MRFLLSTTAATAFAFAAPFSAIAQDAVPHQPAASEQSAPKTSDPNIVVEGERGRRKVITSFIRSAILEEPEGQYAKFDAPICPSFTGFTEDVAAFMEKRMRDVAAAAEIDTASKDCDANIQILVVEDGNTAMKALPRRAFGGMFPYQRRQITEQSGPTYTWHIVRPINTDSGSDRKRRGADPGLSAGMGTYGLLSEDAYNAGRTNVKSRILEPVSQSIAHAFVLIEKDALIGLSPAQIADFATMAALARSTQRDPKTAKRSANVATIRTLFSGPREEAPEVLTDWDLALLASLYAARGDLRANLQRAGMANTFKRVLRQQGS